MYKQPPHNTELSSTRQRKIEDCLLQNMQTQNYDRISVAAMCRQMGISRRLYYTYFPDKESCLISLIDRVLYDSMNIIPMPPEKNRNVSEMIIAYLRFWQEQSAFLDVIVKHRFKDLLIDRTYAYFLNEGNAILSYLNLPDEKACSTTLWVYSAIRFAVIFQWHEHHFETPVEEIAVRYERLLKEPIIHNF